MLGRWGPLAKVEVVPERGFKARIVTKSPGSLVALSHLVRVPLLKALRRIPECTEVLYGDRRGSVVSMFGDLGRKLADHPGRRRNYKVLSADLTAASDLLPMDLVRVLWDEVKEAMGLPDWARWVVDVAIGC
jgi:hypothetical protein